MILRYIAALIVWPVSAYGDAGFGFKTHYVALQQGQGTITCAASPVDGSLFIVATTLGLTINGPPNRIVKIDGQGNMIAVFDFDFGVPVAATVDVGGNLLVVGATRDLAGFPATAQLVPKISGESGFVLKMDPSLTRITSAVLLGGSTSSVPPFTRVTAVSTDSGGNVYVTGSTNHSDFPVTPGAYQTSIPYEGPTTIAAICSYVTKLSPDLAKIAYSTYFGGTHSTLMYAATTRGNAIVVDARGAATIGGVSNVGLPYVYGPSAPSGYPLVARLSPDGTALEAYNDFQKAYGTFVDVIHGIVAMKFDGAGNLWVSGDYPPYYIPYPGRNVGYLAKLDTTLKSVFSKQIGAGFGLNPSSTVVGVELDEVGNVWITGRSAPSYLPGNTPSPKAEASVPYVSEFRSDGSTLLNLQFPPLGGIGMARNSDGALVVIGSSDAFLMSRPDAQSIPVIVASSANNVSTGTVAPGELISLYGNGIGPAVELSGQVISGAFTNRLGGYQVLFNDLPAPLLYVGPDQINTVVPERMAFVPPVGTVPPVATIRVVGPDGTKDLPTITIAPSRPQFFRVVLNQDGTINSASNPADPGSIVTTWATGLGYEDAIDGEIILQPIWNAAVSIISETSRNPLEVTYGSDALNCILGLIQINFRLPNFQITGVALRTSSATSEYVAIYVKQS